MKLWIKPYLYFCVGCYCLFNSALAEAAEPSNFSYSTPAIPWRLAYYQGGDHNKYHRYLSAVINGLMKKGWIQQTPLPEHAKAETLWRWLADNVKSDYVRFNQDAFYSADWDPEKRNSLRSVVTARLRNKQDIDLIIAMGTWAGQDLANNEHSVPTFVLSSSDPIKSGIVSSDTDSGFDHVFARIAPFRYERQVSLFHNFIRFKTLGIAFEDSLNGKTYAAIESARAIAKQSQFDIVECHTKSDVSNLDRANKSLLDCMAKLASKVDAVYVTAQQGLNQITMPTIVDILNKNRIPSFSQTGIEGVQNGLFMSLSPLNFEAVGNYLALSMMKVFSGTKPRDISQLFEEERNIAINLKTAEIIGIYLTADVLAAADITYDTIETPTGYK